MKKPLLIIAGIALTLSAQAQITLNSSNAPSVSQCQTPDSFRRLKLGTLPTFTASTNATWDLTTAGDSSRYFIPGGAATATSAFPNATFYNDAHYNFAVLGYQIQDMKNVAASGIVTYGVHVDRQAISLAPFTGSTSDSVVFPLQDVVFSTPERQEKYPMTIGDSWTDPIKYTTDFNLTIAAYSLNNTPGERHVELTINNKVIGWGKMRVNDEKGNPTGYMDVLMVRSERKVIDSFFLGGNPAPAQLLTAFGLSQGQTQTRYSYTFRRAGEYAPLLEVVYADNTYTTIDQCDVHEDRLKPTAINTISKEQINVYPNPVTNNTFTVKVGTSYSELNYQLYNIAGQMLTAGKVTTNGVVSLQKALHTGTYFIKLQTNNGASGVKQISIIN